MQNGDVFVHESRKPLRQTWMDRWGTIPESVEITEQSPVYRKVRKWSRISTVSNKLFQGYTNTIVRCSPPIFSLSLITSIIICFIGVWIGGMPDLSDPLKGFETRGTNIMDKVLIQRFMSNNIRMLHNITDLEDNPHRLFYGIENIGLSRKRQKRLTSWHKEMFKIISDSPCISTMVPAKALGGLSYVTLKFRDFNSLMSYEVISNFCQLQQELNAYAVSFREQNVNHIINEKYKEFGQIQTSISLPNLIACHFKYSDCAEITDSDVNQFRTFMLGCESERQAIATCNSTENTKICNISKKCDNIVLRDVFKFGVSENTPLQSQTPVYSIYYLPVANAYMVKHFVPEPWNAFRSNVIQMVSSQGFHVAGIEFGMYLHNLSFTLMNDLMWLMLSALVVMLLIVLFTRSILYSVLVIVSIALSVGLSYFLYTMVFRVSFFPLMNSATFILIIGLGADDAFILSYCWGHAKARLKAEGNGSVNAIAQNAFKHAIASMFVTSLTTAIAFYTNIISDIIVIKCFGLLAGTMVLTNFILVFLLLSSFKVIQEHWERVLDMLFSRCRLTKCLESFDALASKVHRIVFGEWLVTALILLKYLILIVGTGFMIGALIVLFYKPKLTIPSKRKAELYVPDSKEEWHRTNGFTNFPHTYHKNKAWIQLIWGVSHVSGYDNMNPSMVGTVNFNTSFKASTSFIRNVKKFTKNLGNTTFISGDWRRYNPWAADFLKWSKRRKCTVNTTLCCNVKDSNFVEDLDLIPCLMRAKQRLQNNVDGPIFRSVDDQFQVVAWSERMKSSFLVNELYAHSRVSKFLVAMDTQFRQVYVGSSYSGLGMPIYISSTSGITINWDVENSLMEDTPICMLVSVAVAVLTIVISTLDLKLSLLSALSICSIILVTIASLVLRGWYMGISESTIIILAVGISFDFTLHYAVTFKLTDDKLPVVERIRETYQQIGSAVLAAALTTFVGGATMIKSVVLLLHHFAVFMMIITVVSWLYSTFYFTALLVVCDQVQTYFNSKRKK